MAVVSTFFNTRPFAFRWKKEQGYLDDSGPNGGATVKCLAIKQFCPASVLIRWINSVCCFEWSRSSQTNLVIHHTKRWCCVCGRPTCSVIIRDPTIRGVRLSPGGGTLCPFKPNATASNVKYPPFAHKSSCSVIVSDVVLWGSSLMGWPLHFLWKKGNMQTSGMKPELSALFFFLPFLPFYFLLIPEFVSRLDWQSEGFRKRAAVDFMYHRLTLSDQKPQRLEGQVWPDWLTCQTKIRRSEGRTQTNISWSATEVV